MENYIKILKKLPKNLRFKLIKAIDNISVNKLDHLDIKRLSGYHKLYRCRIGNIRILFQKRDDKNFIMDLGYRGGIYKKLDA